MQGFHLDQQSDNEIDKQRPTETEGFANDYTVATLDWTAVTNCSESEDTSVGVPDEMHRTVTINFYATMSVVG